MTTQPWRASSGSINLAGHQAQHRIEPPLLEISRRWQDQRLDPNRNGATVTLGPVTDHQRFLSLKLQHPQGSEKRLRLRLNPAMLKRKRPGIDVSVQIVMAEQRPQVVVNVADDSDAATLVF